MSSRPARALVIGASGFLGSRLLSLAPADIDVVGTWHRRPLRLGRWGDCRLDVGSPAAVREAVERERPGVVLYLSYDKADRTVTVDGAYQAARAASALGARFLFVSTDLVFDGGKGNYSEIVPAQPVLPYGRLKLEAEAAVWSAYPVAVILRPSLMVGESGELRRPAYESESLMLGRPVELYVDEWRSPVHVDDVARAAWALALGEVAGIYHCGGPERLSRFELGKVLCALYGYDPALLVQARRPKDRPQDTSLDSRRLAGLLGSSTRPLAALAAASGPHAGRALDA